MTDEPVDWLSDAILREMYLQSFADSNGALPLTWSWPTSPVSSRLWHMG